MSNRVIGYVRVSTGKQADEGVSLAQQRRCVESYCATYGLTLVAVVVDSDASGGSLARPKLQRVRQVLRRRPGWGLVVPRLDRLTRSVRDLAELLDPAGTDRLGSAERPLHSVLEHVDTTTPSGRMMLNLLTTVAQWQREEAARATRVALRDAQARGQPLGAVPYGWRRVLVERDERGRRVGGRGALVPHLEQQAILAGMRTRRAEGASLALVADELTAAGVVGARGGRWTATRVLAALGRA